jgi:hypothetical protein
MAIRFSDAATALMAGDAGLRRALSNAKIVFYTGSQPTSANDSYGSAQPIIAFSVSDGAVTDDVQALAVFDFTGVATGETVTSITVGGFEILGATVTSVANSIGSLLAAQINKYLGPIDFTASASGETVTVYSPKNSGTAFNNASIVAGGTAVWTGAASHMKSGAVASSANPNTWSAGNGRFGSGGGGNTAGVAGANGLTFDWPVNNTTTSTYDLSKPSTETWSGSNGYDASTATPGTIYSGITTGTTYTAGWGRILCSATDTGSAATSGATGFIRVDFSVGTSGTDFIMAPAATFTVNTTTPITTTINSFTLQIAKNLA